VPPPLTRAVRRAWGKPLASNDISLRTAKVTAIFCALAAGVYAAVQAEPSPSLALFFSFGPLLAVILWLQKDARRTGVASVLDLGFFLWLAWPIVIPWYAFKTRGSAGWRLFLGLFVLISSAYLGWLTTAWALYGVRYASWYFRAGA